MQAQAMLKQDAGIHAGEHRHMARRSDRELAELEIASEIFVGLQQFVSNGQGGLREWMVDGRRSLAKCAVGFANDLRLTYLRPVYPLQSAREAALDEPGRHHRRDCHAAGTRWDRRGAARGSESA